MLSVGHRVCFACRPPVCLSALIMPHQSFPAKAQVCPSSLWCWRLQKAPHSPLPKPVGSAQLHPTRRRPCAVKIPEWLLQLSSLPVRQLAGGRHRVDNSSTSLIHNQHGVSLVIVYDERHSKSIYPAYLPRLSNPPNICRACLGQWLQCRLRFPPVPSTMHELPGPSTDV